MPWFKVDDGFHSSRKLLSIPKRHRLAAAGLWAIAGSWSAHELTDGHVPDYMLEVWGATPSVVTALLESGLWERIDDANVFYKWHEYQPSKRDVDAERETSRARMRDLRARRKQQKPRKDAEEKDLFGRTPSEQFAERSQPPTRPDPTHKERTTFSHAQTSGSSERATRFDEFWSAYPRKVGKDKAKAKYTAAVKRAGDEQTIIDGAHRLSADPNLPEKQFIPHPTTWLERGGWNDEPLPARTDNLSGSQKRLQQAREAFGGVPEGYQPPIDPFAAQIAAQARQEITP